MADALRKGLSVAATMRLVRPYEDAIAVARSRQDEILARQEALARDVATRSQLGALADAAGALSSAEVATRRLVLDLLQVCVEVTGWEACGVCGGKGIVATDRPDTGRDRRGWRSCPRCRRRRRLPAWW